MVYCRYIVFALTASLCLPLAAQVYTWTDENGKVHFSDQRRVENAEATQIDIGSMPAPIPIDFREPASFPARLSPLVLDELYYGDSVSIEDKPIVTYYFGGDCVSPTSQDFNQLRTTFPIVLRDEKSLMADVFRALRTKAYGSLYRVGHYSTPDLQAVRANLLSGEIIDLKINACRSQLTSGARTGDLENAHVRDFDLINAWVQVRWQLVPTDAKKSTYHQVTEGVAATRLDQQLDLAGAVRQSFDMAINNLIAQEGFRELVILPAAGETIASSVKQPDSKQQSSSQAALVREEGGIAGEDTAGQDSAGEDSADQDSADQDSAAQDNTSQGDAGKVADYNPLNAERQLYRNALLRSNFVRVLSELTVLKNLISEYYMVRGVMPLTLGDVGFSSDAATQNRYIDSIKMRAPGVIYVELAEEHLPGSHFLQLAPEEDRQYSLIRWQCTTSLDQNITHNNCHNP